MTGNGVNRVVFPATYMTGLSFHAIDNDLLGNGTMDGNITEVTKSGNSFVWTLNITAHNETPIDWDDFLNGGTLSVAGGGTVAITAVNAGASQVTTSGCNIPFSVTDDDTVTTLGLPDTALMVAKFQPAYVLPKMDGGGNAAYDKTIVPFVTSVNTSNDVTQIDSVFDSASAFESEGWRKNDYWVAYALSGFEPSVSEDNDPGAEDQTYGVTWGVKNAPAGTACRGSMVFVETMADAAREKGLTAAQAVRDAQLTIVHEIGHQFYIQDETGPRGNKLYSYAGKPGTATYYLLNNLPIAEDITGTETGGCPGFSGRDTHPERRRSAAP